MRLASPNLRKLISAKKIFSMGSFTILIDDKQILSLAYRFRALVY